MNKNEVRKWSPLILVAALAIIFSNTSGRTAAISDKDRATIDVTEGTFEAEVAKAEGLVAVDFWAVWCGPCRIVGPVLEDLAKEYDGKVKIVKVDVDHNPKIAQSFQIQSIPTILLFEDGKVLDAKIGAHQKLAYAAWFDEHL